MARKRPYQNAAISSRLNTEDVAASPPPAAKRRKTSGSAASAAPPSTDCPLADKTNCPDRNAAVVVRESGDDCRDAAASKSVNDSFQLKVCLLD